MIQSESVKQAKRQTPLEQTNPHAQPLGQAGPDLSARCDACSPEAAVVSLPVQECAIWLSQQSSGSQHWEKDDEVFRDTERSKRQENYSSNVVNDMDQTSGNVEMFFSHCWY